MPELERAAISEGRPIYYAAIASAIRRWTAGGRSLRELLDRKEFLNADEAAAVASAIYTVGANTELRSRLQPAIDAELVEAPRNVVLQEPAVEARDTFATDRIYKVTPARALKDFKLLRPGAEIPEGWLGLQRRLSFDLAVTTDTTLLKRAHSLIEQAIAEGKTTMDEAVLTLEEFGVTSKNPQYAEMVFRTNVQSAYNTGYYDGVAKDKDIADAFPYWEYIAVEDARLGADHAAHLTGGIGGTRYYRKGQTFDAVRGPRVYNCRCSMRWLHVSEAEEIPELRAA